MAPIPNDAFRRLFRSLSRAERTSFVTALWAARGAEARAVERGVVAVTDSETGAVRRLYVLPRRRFQPPRRLRSGTPALPADVDAVVTTGDGPDLPPGVDRYRPNDLRDMALYGIDRATCRELFDRFFDRSPTGWPDSTAGPSDTDRSTGAERWSAPVGWRLRAAGVALLVVAVLVLAGATSGGGPLVGVVGSGTDSPAPDTPMPADSNTVTPVPTPSTPVDAANGDYPPGIGPSGITDGYALATAHASAADGRSYRLTLIRHEYVDGNPVAHGFETVWVEAPTVYVSTVGRSGGAFAGTSFIDDAARYADGSDEYVRQVGPDGADYYRTAVPLRTPAQGRYGARAETYLGWFLTVEQSRIASTTEHDGQTRYWVAFRGDPWPGVTNTTGYALVGADGFVYEVHRQHSLPGAPGRTVESTIRYDEVGSTTVSPPWWFPDARNATGAGTPGSTTGESWNATGGSTPAAADAGVRETRHGKR